MKRAGLVLVSATLLGVGVGGTGSTAAPTPEAMDTAEAKVASAVQVPPGNKLVAKFHAKGVQTYTCTAGVWKSLEPAATLADRLGRAVALHTRGPIWVSTVDGSAVEAAPVDGARNDVAGAVPELLLKAKSTRGDGCSPRSPTCSASPPGAVSHRRAGVRRALRPPCATRPSTPSSPRRPEPALPPLP
jgi:hypothetical protein